MKKQLLISLFALPLILSACGGNNSSNHSSSGGNNGSSDSSGTSDTSGSQGGNQDGHSESEVTAYMNNLKSTSQADHFYLHYYRYAQTVEDYNNWDVWSWAYYPKRGEGYRFDWVGRTSSSDHKTATGDAVIDSFGYVTCDIDLTKNYDGGWNNTSRTFGGTPANYYQTDGTTLDEAIGIQIVNSAGRLDSSSEFWPNDSGDLLFFLADYALENNDGTTSYHLFAAQDKVQEPTTTPPLSNEDPFANDDGTNTTFGNAAYANVNFNENIAKSSTSPLFLSGSGKDPDTTNGDRSKILKYGAGVGYQIMVSSFADSDGDGFGDIYGITQKLDYLEKLGVNVLWLTPIQLSDSYHGYDISDYEQVDSKFGSTASPHVEAGQKPTSESAMEDYKDLITAAHKKGMAVVMDLVLNHTSPTNKWFIKSAQLDADYRGFYQWGNHETDKTGKITQEKCWYPYGDHVYSYYAKFGSSMPELNYAYVPTRTAVATMAKQWCEIGVDGFRMDAVKHIFMSDEVDSASTDTIVEDKVYYTEDIKDTDGKVVHAKGSLKADYSSNLTKNLHFWKYLNKEVKSAYPNCFFVGENFDGDAYNVTPFYEGFDSLFDFYSYFNLTTIAAKAAGNSSASGGPTSAHAFIAGSTDNKWDLVHVLNSNNSYRSGNGTVTATTGFNAINGCFTSNHDIARTINRIHGSHSDSNGIDAQGNVTSSDYAKYDKYALLTQIVEVLLPGCTWIYYGDELGMTGNFPAKDKDNKTFTSESAYADLYYRQPMKWTQNGSVGDGSYTTGYNVTGSSMTVEWDSINASTAVSPATSQASSSSSHFTVLSNFVKLKATTSTLIRGSLESYTWGDNKWVFNFHRKLGDADYAVVVNMGTNSLSNGLDADGYKLDAYYNGSTVVTSGSVPTSLAGLSALVCHK